VKSQLDTSLLSKRLRTAPPTTYTSNPFSRKALIKASTGGGRDIMVLLYLTYVVPALSLDEHQLWSQIYFDEAV